jgi:hypothetical protein
MTKQDDLIYHRQRATEELNRGLAASCIQVARSHLRLSSLHFERARLLSNDPLKSEPPPFLLA